MTCQVCKSDCMAPSVSTGSSFSIHLLKDHLVSVIIPCNVRVEFNELVCNIVSFQVHGNTYNIRVNKERNWTCLHGEGWAQLIAKMNLSVDGIFVFSIAGPRVSRINVAYINYDNNEDDAVVRIARVTTMMPLVMIARVTRIWARKTIHCNLPISPK